MDSTTAVWEKKAREVAARLAPEVGEGDRTGDIATAAFEAIKEEGISAALVPTEFGGGGASHADMGSILRILGAADPSTAVTLSMHAHVVAAQVWGLNHGTDPGRVLGAVAEGSFLASGGASDWIGSSGSATRVDGGFVVSARKAPISGCEVADVLVSSARWETAPEGPSVIHFPVPLSSDGVTIEQTWDSLGLRATGSHTVVLEEFFVPDGSVSLTRPATEWHPIWSAVLGAALPLIMSAYLGIADRAVETALDVSTSRASDPPHGLLGEMLNAHTTAADAVDAMFASADDLRFDNTVEMASLALRRKTVAAEAVITCVRRAMESVGGASYSRALPLERLYRDVLGCAHHPLPRHRQVEFSGRVAMGLDPVSPG